MNLDNLGFICVVEGDAYGYLALCSFFLIVTLALPTVGAVTRRVNALKRRGLEWDPYKTLSSLASEGVSNASASRRICVEVGGQGNIGMKGSGE